MTRTGERGLVAPSHRPEIPGGGPQTVAAVLDRWVTDAPDREALVGRHGRLTFGDLDAAVNRAANAFRGLGVAPGDRVAACLPNDVDIVVAFLATQRLGAIWVGVNRVLAPPEKGYILRDSGASVYLAEADGADEIAGERAGLPDLAQVITVDPWRAALSAASDSRIEHDVDPFAPAAIAYTSGTTGSPKGAVHSQHNLLLPGAVARVTGRFPAGLCHSSVLPLTILNLVVLEVLLALQDGRCLVCIDRIDPEGIAEWVRAERIGALTAVPTVFHDLLTNPKIAPEDLASLVEPGVGGADVPPDLVALYRERFGREVVIGYGMTEAPTAVTWSDGQVPPQPGLCGKPVPQVEIEILGEDGAVLPAGEVGEICVRPARNGAFAGVYTPMLGYWNRPEATVEALRDERYHTGDLGLFAADGNLFIRGRRGELILRGGANVYPAEIERALQEHPAVAAAAVFGIADARLGERVVAVVQPEPAARPDPAELRSSLREKLARYKVPDEIRLTAEMPRNAMGKIVKRELAPLFAAKA